jgi:nucleotide-binding universal stress UspA family protein
MTPRGVEGCATSAPPCFQRVLLPLDGSQLACAALRSLQQLLRHGQVEVTLARVVEPNEAVAFAHGSAAELAMRANLEQTRSQLGDGLASRIELLRGDPAEEILRASAGHDLVAMTTHGRTGLDRWVRGSVAERVLRSSTVPLLLCNPHTLVTRAADRLERIVVPLDGSAEGLKVLPVVQRIAAAHDAHVTLLTVEVPALTELPGLGHGEDPAACGRVLRSCAEELRGAGLRVDVEEAFGPVASEILRVSRRADLLAMTTHGRSGPGRWWFGSIAEEVLRRVTCPLLLVLR